MRATFERVKAPSLATVLRTPRLILRPGRESDVGTLLHALRKNADHLRPWSPAPPPGQKRPTLASAAHEIARFRALWRRGISCAFYLFHGEDKKRIVGRATLGTISRGVFQNAYLGYWIDEDLQGTGLMTEAVRKVVDFAFSEAELHRVQAGVMPRNAGSIRVLEKCGFRREGQAERYLKIADRWEDHVLFAVTAEEWPRTQ
jgi:ribosomal-protein-alanine N-acetyltransferase